ncbi:MAG: polysaccharide biosynthesis/export family protein [Armatimonadota bacterium]|jgi:polysaccharide export outer membrane protein
MTRLQRIVCLVVMSAALSVLIIPVVWADGSNLVVGDVVSVVVDGEKELTKPYEINAEGCIRVSMIGEVKLQGLNTSEAAAVLTEALTDILVNPQVSVQFLERAKMNVFVVGQVLKRGLVDVGVGDRVIQALAQAGYDDTAELSHVNVRRGDKVIDLDLTKYLTGEDLSVNIELLSGDTVVVPRVDMIGSVMVLGQAAKTGPVPLKRDSTFRDVMGLIGNVNIDADLDNITIKREGVQEPIHVDYKMAMAGVPEADVKILPGDTIFVPQTEGAFFTVLGGVNRPGQYPLKDKLMLSEAIGAAGGATINVGDLRKVQVMRGTGRDPKQTETTNFDLTKILQGGLAEPAVQRGDVIYVAVHKPSPTLLQMLQYALPFAWLFRR